MYAMRNLNKILFISPHTDDVELGAGGTLMRFAEEKKDIYVAAFSTARESLKAHGLPQSQLEEEFNQSMEYAGVSKTSRFIYDFPLREFTNYRQDILNILIELRNKIKPDLVIIPSQNDIHQDHQVIHNECIRSFKFNNIWCYELPWNQLKFNGVAYISLTKNLIDRKLHSLSFYKSQISLSRSYFDRDFITGLARVRGCQSSLDFAEAFEVIREYYP